MFNGSSRESMQVTMATPACAIPSKPPRSNAAANVRFAAEEVVEVPCLLAHGPER